MKKIVIILFVLITCGGKKEGNQAPQLKELSIIPEQPSSNDRLTITANVTDPDGDQVILKCQWLRNSSPITDANTKTLEPDNFIKGDLISVIVTPNDGKVDGNDARAEVRIKGTPPLIASAVLEVDTLNHQISVKTECSDPDGDRFNLSYRWLANGEDTELEGRSVSLTNFNLGDKIMAVVTAEDDDGSAEKTTPVFGGKGQPPVITSSPPTGFRGRHFEYQIHATDPDGEEIRYTLKDEPAGMKVDDGGLITWDIKDGDTLVYRVIAEVRDASGNITFQPFTLDLTPLKK